MAHDTFIDSLDCFQFIPATDSFWREKSPTQAFSNTPIQRFVVPFRKPDFLTSPSAATKLKGDRPVTEKISSNVNTVPSMVIANWIVGFKNQREQVFHYPPIGFGAGNRLSD